MESLVPLPYLTIGSKVEFSSKEEGYKGSYFTATIVDTPQPTTNNNNTYVIQYDNITNEDGTKPLRELAHVSCIRPLPPQPLVEDKEQHSSCSFVLNDVVEAFYNDGWWVGVVDKVKRSGGSGSGGGGEMKRYRVRFEDPLHFIEFDENLLRPHFDWVDGKWVSFDSSTKKTTPASFKSHSVSNYKRKGLLEKSLSSEKISLNVISPSKTQQETVTPKRCSKKLRKEEGEGTLSRVSKDKSKVKSYASEKEKSTLSKSKKAKKSLEETSPETKFIDVICGSLSAMEKRADGREHLRKIVLEKSGLSSEKKSVDMVLPSKKRQLEILTSRHCSKKLKSVECGGASFSASKDKSNQRPYVSENEGPTFSSCLCRVGGLAVFPTGVMLVQHLQSGVSVPRKRRVRRRPKKFGQVSSGHECKTVTDSASAGKEPKVNMTAEALKFQDTENTILRSAGPESESITDTASAGKTVTDTASASAGKEPKVNITAEAFKFQDTENTILRSGQVRNGDGGSNGDETVLTFASTEEGLELESVTLDASRSESTFVESGLQELTAKETVENSSTGDIEKDTRITIMELTAGTKTTSEVALPFVKNLIIWETLESFEVYKKMPQKPHFRPLYEEVELLREGLAIGRVVNFTNIVDIIGKLRFDDSNSATISTLIEDILKVLPEFDEHGFDTEPLKTHLGKLVSARSNVAQLEVEAKETKSQLMEKSRDKIRIKEKSNVVAKELVEIVKKFKDLEDQKHLAERGEALAKVVGENDSLKKELVDARATPAVEESLKKELLKFVMVILKGSVAISFGGNKEAAAYAELVSMGGINKQVKRNLIFTIGTILQDSLSIPRERFFLKVYDTTGGRLNIISKI
ncbi:hypothetical protein ACFE04_003266 [Oxalis oulophora]